MTSCKQARICVAGLALWLGLMAWGQQLGTAGLYGTVYDPQGSVIPGAQLTLTHVERNQSWEAVTNNQGQYAFQLIPVGTYRLGVSAPGFKHFEQSGITLQVNDNRKVDVTLEVGDIATRVIV
ncbi:MAG: carboxypeptidase-like regulatory domain-containing protein, partial [Bryobacteraceae bacterium]